MAILTGFLTSTTISSLTYSGYNASISISFYSDSPKKGRLLSASITTGIITNNLPVSTTPRQITAGIQRCWWDDLYNRVHIYPGVINAGNVLITKTYDVEVWSAYLVSNTLANIVESATDGISLIGATSPDTFAPTESKVYTAEITLNGPVTINALYTLQFGDEAPTLSITGKRAVLWPFPPDNGYTEKLKWKTDIITAVNAEQRIANREAPRQSFEQAFLLDQHQFSVAKAIASQWGNKIYGVPVWNEMTYLSQGLSSGITSISFDTSYADYREGGYAVIWESDRNFSIVEITTILSNQISIRTPLEKTFGPCYIMPTRFGRTLDGMSFSRTANKSIQANTSFEITDNIDLSNEGAFVTYRSKPVLTDRSVVFGDISESLLRVTEYFDNGQGLIEVEPSTNWTNFQQTISFAKSNAEDIWKLRQWVHARRGQQKTFWLPSWNVDLVILGNVSSESSTLVIENIGYSLYYGVKDIMITLKNGSRIFVRGVSAQEGDPGEEIINLSATIGTSFAASDVDFVCFLSHVRFNTDDISFTHDYKGRVKTTINVMEVPE